MKHCAALFDIPIFNMGQTFGVHITGQRHEITIGLSELNNEEQCKMFFQSSKIHILKSVKNKTMQECINTYNNMISNHSTFQIIARLLSPQIVFNPDRL